MIMLLDHKSVFHRLGFATLMLASLLLLLAALNVRSRLYYHGPDFSFLFWLFAWAAAAGVGLLLLRKWAVLLLFFPGIAFAGILSIGLLRGPAIPMWAVAVNLLFVSVTVAAPIALLRYWKTLHW